MKVPVMVEKEELGKALNKPKTPRLAIVIGHTEASPGAFGHTPINDYEYGYNSDLADLIKECGKISRVSVKIFTRDDVGIKGCYELVEKWEPDACIELHFNAYDGSVQGTETLYSDDNDDKGVDEERLALLVNDGMLKALGESRSNRRLKKRPSSEKERGWYNVNQVNHFASILVEPFFGDNPNEAKLAVKNKEFLARAIVNAFLEWL